MVQSTFVQPPDLVEATTTDVNVWGTTYISSTYPQNAENPSRVTITQRSGTSSIRYDLDDTRAFVGARSHKGRDTGRGNSGRETRTVFR